MISDLQLLVRGSDCRIEWKDKKSKYDSYMGHMWKAKLVVRQLEQKLMASPLSTILANSGELLLSVWMVSSNIWMSGKKEIEVLQNLSLAGDLVVGVDQFNRVDPPQILDSITLSPGYPCLSSISMVAPITDWFSGIDSFSPRGPGGYWYETFEIATYPFDAGTEEGTTYSINNAASSPHRPIYPLTRHTVPESGILLDPTGTTVLPVATWRCDLVWMKNTIEIIVHTQVFRSSKIFARIRGHPWCFLVSADDCLFFSKIKKLEMNDKHIPSSAKNFSHYFFL